MKFFVELLDPLIMGRRVGVINTHDLYGADAIRELIQSVDTYNLLGNDILYTNRTKIIGGKYHGHFFDYNGQRILRVRNFNTNSFINMGILFTNELEVTEINSLNVANVQSLIDFYLNFDVERYPDFYFLRDNLIFKDYLYKSLYRIIDSKYKESSFKDRVNLLEYLSALGT